MIKVIEVEKYCIFHKIKIKQVISSKGEVMSSYCEKCSAEREQMSDATPTNDFISRNSNVIFPYSNFDIGGWVKHPSSRINEIFTEMALHQFCKDRHFFFHGGMATGKTLTASMILRNKIRTKTIFYSSANDFIQSVFNKKDKHFYKCDFLVIDDIQRIPSSKFTVEAFKYLLNVRTSYMNSKSTILISNKHYTEVDVINNPRIANHYGIYDFGNNPFPYNGEDRISIVENTEVLLKYMRGLSNGAVVNKAKKDLEINSIYQNFAELKKYGLVTTEKFKDINSKGKRVTYLRYRLTEKGRRYKFKHIG